MVIWGRGGGREGSYRSSITKEEGENSSIIKCHIKYESLNKQINGES